MKPLELTGRRFGKLTVVRRQGSRRHQSAWLCQCDCGKERTLVGTELVSGKTVSCGCVKAGAAHLVARNKSHGMTGTPEHEIWLGIVKRCTNSRCKAFKDYGGRGVTMCERWATSFEAFLQDVGRRPSPVHSLDRYPNNDGNYEPGNVRWATPAEQNRNTRTNRWIEHDGRRLILADWAKETGLSSSTILRRLARGLPIEACLSRGAR